MMRTLIVVLLAAIMSFSTFGCGGQKPATEEQPAEEQVTPPAPVEEMMGEQDTTGAAVEEHPGTGMETQGAGGE